MMDAHPMIIGIDIGGTFTDFVLLRDGCITIQKLPTTPDDPSRALLEGVALFGVPDGIIHGTTVATNALLERRGARTALLTTAGFADVFLIGRGNRPLLYDLDVVRDPPLIPDDLRLEIVERVGVDGNILTPLDEMQTMHVIRQLVAQQVESVAICFLHSYANPQHEQQVQTLLSAAMHDAAHPCIICISSDVLPEYREYERTSTTVVNAYVAPMLDRYLTTIEQTLATQRDAGTPTRIHILASDGGSMTTTVARQLAARTTLSGPAGGVVGARAIAHGAGIESLITFDMGGTSTDVALCDGQIPHTHESAVGTFPVRFPAIDIHTVGAGGGSIARIDAGGALRVGPESAGAHPGPACYGRGTLPTVTDANLVLGRLQADAFFGGRMHLDIQRAEAAIRPLADALGFDIRTTALGIIRVANAAMERAIRRISVERGIDPRTFTLLAFGGAGPLHAVHLAESLGIRRVLIPRMPGVLSAFGMIMADMSRDYLQMLMVPLAQLTPARLTDAMESLIRRAQDDMSDEQSTSESSPRAEFSLDMRYSGQSHEITTPLVTWHTIHTPSLDLADTEARFHMLHERASGHAMPGHPIEVVSLRLRWVSPCPHATNAITMADEHHESVPHRHVLGCLTGEVTDLCDATRYERASLRVQQMLSAPAIVVQLDATSLIPPGWHATVDEYYNLMITPVGG